MNPADVWLGHGGGAAKCIADAAGRELTAECEDYRRKFGHLSVSLPMHTGAGKLNPPIKYVIHVAGPKLSPDINYNEANVLLAETFFNCLEYANGTLKVSSVAIPAISSGIVTLFCRLARLYAFIVYLSIYGIAVQHCRLCTTLYNMYSCGRTIVRRHNIFLVNADPFD